MTNRILRKYVVDILDKLNISNYYQYVPDTVIFPYCTFKIEQLRNEGGFIQYELEINLLDNNFDSIRIDDLVDEIQKVFNRKHSIVGCNNISTYKNNVNVIDTKDDKLQRRRVTFEMRVTGKI